MHANIVHLAVCFAKCDGFRGKMYIIHSYYITQTVAQLTCSYIKEAPFIYMTKLSKYNKDTVASYYAGIMASSYSYSETIWTCWGQPKVSRLSRCPDFPGQFT